MPTGSANHVRKGASWAELYAQCVSVAPEAFEPDQVRNLWGGEWRRTGKPAEATSPVDGSPLAGPPMLEFDQAKEAVAAAASEHRDWRRTDLDERHQRVSRAVEGLEANRELLAGLLVWEIGKPYRQALTSVDRTISGVRWYLDEIDQMLAGRQPLAGPVSNIASWNYPLSVLAHAMLVQLLAGDAVISKTPTDGGLCALTLATALMRREELPVTLVSGSGGRLSPALVLSDEIGCLAFVGGRDVGGQIASQLVQTDKRHMLEQEGLNAWGIWEFSDWDGLAKHLKKGFEFAKQRCTAYPRYVVQRSLFDNFLSMYLDVAKSLRFGHPLAVADPGDDPPDLDFGPVINEAKARELKYEIDFAVTLGALPIYRGSLDDGWFLPDQDTSAYVPPTAILNPPGASSLSHAEPFGPIDSIVVVDSRAELLAAMNASNGCLVASIATDDEQFARGLVGEVQAFKVGINAPRSRGDKAEPFGGRGHSWKGAFVGGEHLVHAVTDGPPEEKLYGNFPDYQRYPPV